MLLMRITLCGSISFADRIVDVYRRLQELGHEPMIHDHMFGLVDGTAPQLNDSVETSEIKRKYDFIRAWHELIRNSDAILVCNFDKGGISNYIGGNTLMEIGFAHVLGKKVFLLNPVPEDVPYVDEIRAMSDYVLNGDLAKINTVVNPRIILATASPHRQEAFRKLGLKFVAEGSNVDERFQGRPEGAEGLVMQLSKMKAEAVARHHDEGIVIGFDSVGWFNGDVLEKPESREEIFERLKMLSGQGYQFVTGIHMINADTNRELSRVVKTNVFMREIAENEINRFLDHDTNETFKTFAHGFNPICHYSSTFARRIEGSCSNYLWGLPVETIMEMLIEMGYHV
jgi:septum formation protein